MKVMMISAMAKNRVIGNNNDIPWHLPEDFQHFKTHTLNKPVIMGRLTLKSMNYKALPKRENIIITRENIDGFTCFKSLKEAIDYCKEKKYEKACLIGGQRIYNQGLEFCDEIYLTEIDKDFTGDTFFPIFKSNEWKLVESVTHYSEKNDFNYSFNKYVKVD